MNPVPRRWIHPGVIDAHNITFGSDVPCARMNLVASRWHNSVQFIYNSFKGIQEECTLINKHYAH